MERFEALEERIISGNTLSEKEFSRLRAIREHIEDLQDMARGLNTGRSDVAPAARAEGPALAIVVGHTSADGGAPGMAPISSQEYAWNTVLAQGIETAATGLGLQTRIFFRDFIGISGAYRQVRDWGASCAVELHFNSFDGTAFGTETLYDEDRHAPSKAWAEELQDAMVHLYQRTGKGNRGIKERDPGDRGYTSVSSLDVPSALIEPFFGDNPADAELGHGLRDDLASAIARTAAARLLPGV